jgi:hypothetical protein
MCQTLEEENREDGYGRRNPYFPEAYRRRAEGVPRDFQGVVGADKESLSYLEQ